MNDVSMRDWQFRTTEWLQGKSWEATSPLGPYLVTPYELAPNATIRCTVDGDEVQRSTIDDLLFGPAELVGDAELEGPNRLPDWSGKHLLAHVGHNARALGRLAHWAATGEPTPMYPSPRARTADIESGARWPLPRLRTFVDEQQEQLAKALEHLTDAVWHNDVITAQGRTVSAIAIPWLRSRELWIHACDLPSGGAFTAFPHDFVDALIDDALTRRAAQGVEQIQVDGPATDLARWLTGRGASRRLHTSTGMPLPALPPWL